MNGPATLCFAPHRDLHRAQAVESHDVLSHASLCDAAGAIDGLI